MKEEIIEASLQQFLAHGIRKMTIKELISPLGISTKTVYKYFTDKETLLEECLDLHYGRMYADFVRLSREANNPVIFIFQSLIKGFELDFKTNVTFYHDLNYYYPELQDKVMRKNSLKMDEPMADTFDNGITQGYFREGLSARAVMETIGVLYGSITRSERFNGFNLSPFEIADNTLGVYLRGLCTVKGLKEIDDNPELISFNYKPRLQ